MRNHCLALRFALGCLLSYLSMSTPASGEETLPTLTKVKLSGEPMTPAQFAAHLKEQTGIAIEISALPPTAIKLAAGTFDFWHAIEMLADKSGGRIATMEGKVQLQKGKSTAPSEIAGPFRLQSRGVFVRGDATGGPSHYALTIDFAWDPRLHLYRANSIPKIQSIVDGAGRGYQAFSGSDRSFTVGINKELTIRPLGVQRAAKSLSVSGTVDVTLADELLIFTFDALKPMAAEQKRVKAHLQKSAALGKDWVVEVALVYPKESAVWESHEIYWARDNVCRLLPPQGTPITADATEYDEQANRYVFKNRAAEAGWKVDYRTPGVMREVTVPFELKGIVLP